MTQLDRHSTPICFFFNDTATTEIYTLSLHDALPISAGGCSARHPPPVTVFSSLRSWFSEGLFHRGDQLLHAKRFLNARRSALRQEYLRFTVGGVAADENDSRLQFRTVLLDPVMHFRSVHCARHSNVGDYACIPSVGKSL